MNITSTSEFNKDIINKLNIQFQDTDTFLTNQPIKIYEDFYLRDLKPLAVAKFKENNELNPIEKTLCNYACPLTLLFHIGPGTRHSTTDSFIDSILRKLKLDRYPIEFKYNPTIKFQIGSQNILASPEYSICLDDILLMATDDKHCKLGSSYAIGEYNIAGNMLAMALDHYNKISNDPNFKKDGSQIIYSIRIIGTLFTFYKTTIPYSYLDSLKNGFPNDKIIIYRYTGSDPKYGFNYILTEERRIIVDTLCQITSKFVEKSGS